MVRRSLAVLLVIACQPTEPEPAPAPAPPVAAPAPTPAPAPAPAPPVTQCEAEVADVPTALFDDTVLLRLPIGVEVEAVPDRPFLAKMKADQAVSTCGAVVRYAAVGRADGLPKLPVTEIRDTIFRENRMVDPEGLTWSQDHTTDGRHYHGAYVSAAAPGIKGWFVLLQKGGTNVWAMFETDEAKWPALERTFQQAGKRLLVVPVQSYVKEGKSDGR